MTDAETTTFITIVVVTFIILVLFYWLAKNSVKLVRHAEVMIVERFGQYRTTLKPGLHWLWPVIDSPRRINWRYLDAKNNNAKASVVSIKSDHIDMREHVIDFGHQHVITHDTVSIDMDALVYFRVTDPRLAVFGVQNLPDAVELLTQATLRNIVATMTLDDTFSSRELINSRLLSKIQVDAERWGVTITRVEVFGIDPPHDIKQSMESQIKAERERRSMVLHADGERKSAVIRSRGEAARTILQAEGQRSAELTRAAGKAEAKMLIARADASCIDCVRNAINETGVRAVDYLTAVRWLQVLRTLTASQKPSKVILVPQNTIQGIGDIVSMNMKKMR